MATLGTIRTLVRDRLDEDSPRRWTNAQLDRWINEGARDVARRTECLHAKSSAIAVTANTQVTSLSTLTTLLKINRVEWKTDGDSRVIALEYRDYNSMDAVWWDAKETATSTPGYYTLTGNPPALSITVYPIPASAGTITVYYWRLPTEATADADTVEVPEGWHDTLADYAEYKALRRDADPRWREAFDIYKDNLAALLTQTRRYTDGIDVVTPEAPHLASWVWDDTWVG